MDDAVSPLFLLCYLSPLVMLAVALLLSEIGERDKPAGVCPDCQRARRPELLRRVQATLAAAIRLLDGNLYDHLAARNSLAQLLKEIEADE